ncbi:hypothetical protein [uncultured Mailhella sp.]|uniref:hypothetical protein n=1 Tax=uncultured Mailhella sp. TaxID=1981031 RepID=UPI0025E97B20|nr:hypothetical protein [uncultured Mailhella sp.]
MCKTAVILAILLMLPALGYDAEARPSRPLTARQAFALIPTEIFDNTRAPLSESDKDQLADQGVTEHWSIAEDDRDTLRVASADGLPDVSLKMFRSERGAVAAFRTEEDDGECVSELWYISAGGHAAPLPLPPEPAVDDFFRPDRDLPGRISSSCTYCVFDRGLEVLPSFASDGFPCELEPDNAVYYLWNGRTFVKKIKKLR